MSDARADAATGARADTPDAPDAPDAPDRLVELKPSGPTTLWLWFALLGGPTIWITHFMVVYLPAEATCKATDDTTFTLLDETGLRWFVLAATAVAAAGTLAVSRAAWKRWQGGTGVDSVPIGFAGLVTGLLSFVAVLAVGLPAAVMDLC